MQHKSQLSYNEQLQEIYSKIPKVDCKRKCHNACGVIPVQRPELKKIRKKAKVRVDDYLIESPGGLTMMFNAETEQCPVLSENGDCTVYEVRPFICRLFGVVEGMMCPEGCTPERIMTHAEAEVLVTQILQLK